MPTVVCPACKTRIQLQAGTSGSFACPQCQKVLKIKAPADQSVTPSSQPANTRPVHQPVPQPTAKPAPPVPAAPTNSFDQDNFLADLPTGPASGALASNPQTNYYAATKTNRPKLTSDLRTYLKKLGIGLAILSGVILLSIPLLAFPRSPVVLIPLLLVVISMLALIFAGQIWFIVLGFQQSTAKGLMVMLVPYYWLFFLSKNKQACLKPLITMGAALVPAVFFFVIQIFKPDFIDGGRSRPSLQLSSSQRSASLKLLSESVAAAKPGEVVTARFPVFMLTQEYDPRAAEQALARLPGYVPGSFKMASDNKSLTLQYVGNRQPLAMHYGIVLPGEAGIMVNLQATFEGP